MNKYLTVGDAQSELVIQRSRFISFVYHIENEEDATEKLKSLRKQFFDATHVCYAYVADIQGNKIKFSDDGEPSGTAAQPILEVIKARGLVRVLVAVVRYFGGIKLGAGGLTRAYSASATSVLNSAQTEEYIESDVYEITMDFSILKKFEKSMSNILCKILFKEYNSSVKLTLACSVGFDMTAFVNELSAGKALTVRKDRIFIKY